MKVLDKLTGKIQKLTFKAFTDEEFKNQVGEVFTVQFNPKTLGLDYSVIYEEPKVGSATYKYVKSKPSEITFEFTIDGTGIDSSVFDGFKKINVEERIKEFLTLTKEIDPSMHQPPYILISYGNILSKTKFKSCSITYTLFRNDGFPLRAVIKATFLNIKNNVTDYNFKSQNSPDVTHKSVVQEHQSLIEIANKIYERNDLYIEIAKANKLNTFRKAAQLKDLFFPPINK